MQQAQDLAGWVAFFGTAEIPVLRHTSRELERLRADEAQLNARNLAQVVSGDPMMTCKLLRHLQAHKHPSQAHELVQVEQAIMMMGFDAFFRDVPAQPVAEDALSTHPQAMLQLLRTVRRAQRAAHYAFDWALLLHDLHAEEVRIAALLAYLSEMLMWCFNPASMQEIHAMQQADKGLRSVDAQEQVLGFRGVDLQQALQQEWHLPHLLLQLTDIEQARNSRVRCVLLAMSLARHSASGWGDAALPDDYRAIAGLLRLPEARVMEIVGAIPAGTSSGTAAA